MINLKQLDELLNQTEETASLEFKQEIHLISDKEKIGIICLINRELPEIQFEILDKKFITSHFKLLRWMDIFVNIEPVIYERFFAGIFSPEEVYFKLRAVK
jgi:hypothetical protein